MFTFQNLKETPVTPQLRKVDSAEDQARKDAEKAHFNQQQIKHILKSQGTVDIGLMNATPEKLIREKQASPKQRSKLVSRHI